MCEHCQGHCEMYAQWRWIYPSKYQNILRRSYCNRIFSPEERPGEATHNQELAGGTA